MFFKCIILLFSLQKTFEFNVGEILRNRIWIQKINSSTIIASKIKFVKHL